jgi:hypothetical protein
VHWRHIFTLSNRELLICCAHALCSTAAGIAFSSWNEQPENFVTAIATKPLLKVTFGVNILLLAFAALWVCRMVQQLSHAPPTFPRSFTFPSAFTLLWVTISHAVGCWSGAQGFEALQMTHYEMADDISRNGLLTRHCFPQALPSCLNKKVEAMPILEPGGGMAVQYEKFKWLAWGGGSFVKVGEQINCIRHNKAHSREIRGLSLAGHHVDDEEGEKNREQIDGVEDRDLLEEFSLPIIDAVVAENWRNPHKNRVLNPAKHNEAATSRVQKSVNNATKTPNLFSWENNSRHNTTRQSHGKLT